MIFLIFQSQNLITQLTINTWLAILSTCYIIYVKPYTEPALNRQEIINELTILIAAYTLFVYALIVDEKQLEFSYHIGWSHIGILGINWLINMSFMISDSIHSFKLRLKLRRNKKKAKDKIAR